MDYASAPLAWLPEHHRCEATDFLSESVEIFERELRKARREIRGKRARLDMLRLEAERLREDAEQWGEVADREEPDAASRRAHRKLIEKSRGIAVLSRLCAMLERDLAALEPKVKQGDFAIFGLRQELRRQQRSAARHANFSTQSREGATAR